MEYKEDHLSGGGYTTGALDNLASVMIAKSTLMNYTYLNTAKRMMMSCTFEDVVNNIFGILNIHERKGRRVLATLDGETMPMRRLPTNGWELMQNQFELDYGRDIATLAVHLSVSGSLIERTGQNNEMRVLISELAAKTEGTFVISTIWYHKEPMKLHMLNDLKKRFKRIFLAHDPCLARNMMTIIIVATNDKTLFVSPEMRYNQFLQACYKRHIDEMEQKRHRLLSMMAFTQVTEDTGV
jgi:hypothetical protein